MRLKQQTTLGPNFTIYHDIFLKQLRDPRSKQSKILFSKFIQSKINHESWSGLGRIQKCVGSVVKCLRGTYVLCRFFYYIRITQHVQQACITPWSLLYTLISLINAEVGINVEGVPKSINVDVGILQLESSPLYSNS